MNLKDVMFLEKFWNCFWNLLFRFFSLWKRDFIEILIHFSICREYIILLISQVRP